MNFGVSRRVGRGTWVRVNTGHGRRGGSRRPAPQGETAVDGCGMLFVGAVMFGFAYWLIAALYAVWFVTIPCIILAIGVGVGLSRRPRPEVAPVCVHSNVLSAIGTNPIVDSVGNRFGVCQACGLAVPV